MKMKIMTYNMLHIDDNPNNDWNKRKGLISTILQREKPDIIGTQECLFTQVKDILFMNPEFDWVGLGRQGGSFDDFMAVFYRVDRFEVLAYNHFWLSDTPQEIGSMSFGNTLPRMVTWVKFLDVKTGQLFYHMNTHFDYISEKSRIKSAHLINEKANELFEEEHPIFLTGDFNCDIETTPYNTLTEQGPFIDIWDQAIEHINGSVGTKAELHPEPGNERIDWILAKDVSKVHHIKVVNDVVNGEYPSDHFPVIAECRLQARLNL